MQRHDVAMLGGESKEILWRGHRVAFTRHGQGSPVLLVHGMYPGASSLEWRLTIPALAERHTVFALDLLGVGCSDRPAARYSPGLYQALLADVVARVVRHACTVVASGLSAAQLIALAARDPGRIASVALIAPTGVAHLREPAAVGSAATRRLLGAPLVGNAVYNRLTSPARMRAQLQAMYFDDRLVTPELVECHVRSAQQPGGKPAIRALLDGRLNVDVRAAVRRLRLPTLLLWGDVARQNPVAHAHAFRVLKHDLEWTLVHDAGDLPHDERSVEVNLTLRSFLERTRRWSGEPEQRLAMA
ncbi:MAG TPA: alpha/beta fold hydrolase [Gemmatimonadaceae bacterium]